MICSMIHVLRTVSRRRLHIIKDCTSMSRGVFDLSVGSFEGRSASMTVIGDRTTAFVSKRPAHCLFFLVTGIVQYHTRRRAPDLLAIYSALQNNNLNHNAVALFTMQSRKRLSEPTCCALLGRCFPVGASRDNY